MKKQQQERRTFWRAHVEARGSFAGSTKEYCRQHGLKESQYYSWKRRLSSEDKASPFAKVNLARAKPQAVKVRESKLPDPEWTAKFLLALTSGGH